MVKAVFDTNLLVSAFLSRENPGGASNELLRFVTTGAVELYLSVEIIDEAIEVLMDSPRLPPRYGYTAEQVGQYRADLMTLATIVDDPTPTPGAVPRDPDDDKIIACAVAAGAEYLVSRDHDLLSIGSHAGVTIIPPEDFLRVVRSSLPRS
jgi:putative PIN family toxin of toxin-antitoxin system